MLSKILIIDKRKELSTKYKKALCNDEISAVITNNLKDAIKQIQDLEPDLILVSDSINEKLTDFCSKIRSLTYNTRPVIVALSKSADASDRIEAIESGADDFLSEPVNIEEFKARIYAHLRRDIESNLDNKTLLPNRKIVEKSLKRILTSPDKYAVLLIGIENLENYKSVYSEVAGDKIIQTFAAIAKSTLEGDDFFGQINETEFVIITNIYKAEKMAAFLTFAFDTVIPKFYSEKDVKRGYTLLKGDRKAGMRANFVSMLIGGMVDNFNLVSNVDSLLAKLYSIKKLAKVPEGSNYLMDRIQISGESAETYDSIINTIYINESDEALALLLRTTLELQGYNVTEEILLDAPVQPGIIILDSKDDLSQLELCKKLKNKPNFVNSKIIVTTTIHDKSKILDAGADLYLPKPYELSDLIRWIEYFQRAIS